MIKNIILEQSEPPIKLVNNKKYYYDSIRTQFVLATPKEKILQQTINFLTESLKIPKECLELNARKGREKGDIIILDDNHLPLCIISCHEEKTLLTDTTARKAIYHANLLECDFVFNTNGKILIAYRYIDKEDRYMKLVDIPSYETMIGVDCMYEINMF